MKGRRATAKAELRSTDRLKWLKIVSSLALSCSLILSRRLWFSARTFPLAPLVSVGRLPAPIGYICFGLLLLCSILIAVVARPRTLIIAFLILAAFVSVLDQMRWQPWFYQYVFILAAVGVAVWREPKNKKTHAATNASALIFVSTYFWSGVNKLNVNFIRQTWPDLSSRLFHLVPAIEKPLLRFTGGAVPLVEICVAVGLLTRKFRNAAVIAAVVTHVVVLSLLISSGENTVVWPWNVAMALSVIIIFRNNNELNVARVLASKQAFQILILILFGLLPALSVIDSWDSYLSSALYSGNTYQGVVLIDPAAFDRLPATLRPYVWQQSDPWFLDLNRWSYGELNVPIYPEPRIFRTVAAHVCDYAHTPGVRLELKGKPDLFTGVRESQYYDCDHLR
jgi:hypothetical protein